MSVKLSGTDFKAWIASDWGHPDAWWEDEVITVDGVEADNCEVAGIPDHAVVVVTGGVILSPLDAGMEDRNAETELRRWLRARSTAHVVVEVEKEQVQNLKALLKREKIGKVVA